MQKKKKKRKREKIIISKVYDTFLCSHNDFLHFLVFVCALPLARRKKKLEKKLA